jgi:peptidylprolyl isomerase
MTQAKQGDKVKVHYHGTLEDGTVFESSHEKEPLEFTIGEGNVLSGVENAVQGMNEGETKNVQLGSEEAFGEYDEQNTIEVNRSDLPENIEPEVGMPLKVNTPDGQTVYVTITDMDEEKVTLDANHPLAGQDLYFEIQLLEIEPQE